MKKITINAKAYTKAEKVKQLIKKGLDGKSSQQKISILEKWIADKKDLHSPVSFLGEKLYENYLCYLPVNGVDERINNAKPFNPQQNYHQEWNRLIKLNSLDGLFKKDEKFQLFCYTVDCALQDRFFRKLKYANPTTTKTTKLW